MGISGSRFSWTTRGPELPWCFVHQKVLGCVFGALARSSAALTGRANSARDLRFARALRALFARPGRCAASRRSLLEVGKGAGLGVRSWRTAGDPIQGGYCSSARPAAFPTTAAPESTTYGAPATTQHHSRASPTAPPALRHYSSPSATALPAKAASLESVTFRSPGRGGGTRVRYLPRPRPCGTTRAGQLPQSRPRWRHPSALPTAPPALRHYSSPHLPHSQSKRRHSSPSPSAVPAEVAPKFATYRTPRALRHHSSPPSTALPPKAAPSKSAMTAFPAPHDPTSRRVRREAA
ncbi:hypothetical protein FNL39_10271 [Nocardia caishijiensis]|uniref:Uncharacterized protein n=1 Tax=Nocardia caishijiensis TaxID=184756 RepID=A0ABQ6YR12_9NOCA|nr:hypothetical protein FNL39_10271 [Nocardia caishijiensis]